MLRFDVYRAVSRQSYLLGHRFYGVCSDILGRLLLDFIAMYDVCAYGRGRGAYYGNNFLSDRLQSCKKVEKAKGWRAIS